MKWLVIFLVLIGLIWAFWGLVPENKGNINDIGTISEENINMNMQISIPVLGDTGNIPIKYTCDGEKINPPIIISGVPSGTKSLVLIIEDPDVPKSIRPDGMWNHWIKFNLSPDLAEIGEGKDPGGISGLNTSGNLKYVPPCPPDGEHRYFFKLFALDTMLNLKEGAKKEEVLSVMSGHILEEAVTIGRYKR